VSGDASGTRRAERLGTRTLALIAIASESGEEAAILSAVRSLMPADGTFELVDERDSVLFYAPQVRRPGVPFVVLAGHVDTVPRAGSLPPAREQGVVVGRGAADMKGAVSVMVEIAGGLARGDIDAALDVGFLFFGREELPITQSALLPFFARCALGRTVDLAVVMEPTANRIEVGCLGNLNAWVTARGVAAHSARPWLGDNAVHTLLGALGPLMDLPARDVEIEGLVFHEVVSVTTIAGGVAANVVPDHAEARVNLRYAPNRTPQEAEDRLRELLGGGRVELQIVGNSPPGPVTVANPLVTRLRQAGGLDLGPKQAWTPVAEFATVGVDAVNLGPGDPQYAHRDDERVETAALTRSYEVLHAFISVAGGG
jgi:succinyl-diaminopimelate desuccinylase